ncbi:uncharacterized protein LOC120522910 [Polypterus senegalus]|uniref:uncharacterized protein LOC120522910 n=1 Tax=Polypterus senegalus TaxID=55291 RepID=UPI00196373D1|nr:uncharacterized protein LOC120522910 [Polypterus senegalus]
MNVRFWKWMVHVIKLLCTISDHYGAAVAGVHVEVTLRGTVTFNCNASHDNIVQLNWKKSSSCASELLFAYTANETFINTTTERIKWSKENPLTLHITDVQSSDEGNYSCDVTSTQGVKDMKWELTVRLETAVPNTEMLKYVLFSLCGISLILVGPIIYCCTRRQRRSKQDQNLRTNDGNGAELTENLSNLKNRRSNYFERLNSVYESIG